MPSARSLAGGSGTLAVLAFTGLAAAQSPSAGTELGLTARIGIRFAVALVVNLLLAGALVGFSPEYAAETVAELRADPASAFGWGLLVGIGVPIGLALLAITIIGLLVVIPAALVLVIVGLVGSAVSIVWVGTVLTGDGIDARTAAVGALAVAVPTSIPVLGDLVSSLVGFFGLGVVGRRLYRSWRG